jgi:replication fork protection complex subunit Tof1/Swi1
MSLPSSPDFAHEASRTLQHQLYYNGEILEIALDSLKGYKEQSIACDDQYFPFVKYVLLTRMQL